RFCHLELHARWRRIFDRASSSASLGTKRADARARIEMNDNTFEDQPIAWTPTPDVIERARLTEFMRQVGVSTWDELYEFSIRDVERFTEEVLKFLDIRFDPPYTKLLDTTNGIEFPEWLQRNADAPVRNESRNADAPVRNESRNADAPVRNESRNADAPVRHQS